MEPKPAVDHAGISAAIDDIYPKKQPPEEWPTWLLALAAVAGVGAGFAGGLFIPSPDAETVTPDACIEAIDIADEALAVTSGSLGTIAEAFTALADGNDLLADIIMQDLDGDTDTIVSLQDDYHAAKDECRGAQA